MKLPLYRCHKEVSALKIDRIEPGDEAGGILIGTSPDKVEFRVEVPASYLDKFKPVVGGYYVEYADGYKSFSPARAFEDGYSLIPEWEESETRLGKPSTEPSQGD